MKKDELLEAKEAADYARTLINLKKFKDARYLLDLVLTKYPEFPSAKLQYGILKIATGNIEEGIEILDKLKETYENEIAILLSGYAESNFGSIEKAREYFNMLMGTSKGRTVLLESIYLDIREEKYEAAYEKINRGNIKLLYPRLYTFIIIKLGITDRNLWIPTSDYFVKQMVNYSEKEALEHILSHGSESEHKKVHGVFAPYVDIEKLFFGVRSQLKRENAIRVTESDMYKFYCPNIGKDQKGRKANYCYVVTIHDKPDILTMYPSNLGEYRKKTNYDNNATIGEEFKIVAAVQKILN